MSLLLEALKKAELAKQQTAAHQGDGHAPPDAAMQELRLEPVLSELAERPLMTRDRLPDISQPLEIHSEDLPSAGIRRPTVRAQPAPPQNDAGAALASASLRDAEVHDGHTIRPLPLEEQERGYARQLFDAKLTKYNPRRPFYIVVGALVAAGVAIAVYFYFQIAVPRQSTHVGVTKAAIPSADVRSGQQTQQEPARVEMNVSGSRTPSNVAGPSAAAPIGGTPMPPADAAATRVAKGSDVVPKGMATRPATIAADPPPTPSDAPSRPAALATIAITPPTQRIDPSLERGWDALQSGDLDRARDEYAHALKANPLDRDALLGLAAIDTRTRNYDSAEARYLRVLEIDPRDAYAQAGVIALRGQLDPVQSESRLKNLLAQQPDAAFLNFALGNQYAAQSRWPEAQAAYFKAYAADPDNADHAFNLAVSLDHLRQPKLALDYYRRALELAAARHAGFDKARIETRIRELQR